MKQVWPNRPSTKALLGYHNPASYKSSTCLMQLFGREHHILRPLLVEHYFMGWYLKGRLHSPAPSFKGPKEQAHGGQVLVADSFYSGKHWSLLSNYIKSELWRQCYREIPVFLALGLVNLTASQGLLRFYSTCFLVQDWSVLNWFLSTHSFHMLRFSFQGQAFQVLLFDLLYFCVWILLYLADWPTWLTYFGHTNPPCTQCGTGPHGE